MIRQNNSLASIMANFDSRSITVQIHCLLPMRPLFFLLKKPYQTLFYLWTSAEIDLAFFFSQKTNVCKKVPTYLRSDSFCDAAMFGKTGNPLIKYGGVIRFRHVLSFFFLFFFQETRSWVECASLLWLWNVCFRLPSSV